MAIMIPAETPLSLLSAYAATLETRQYVTGRGAVTHVDDGIAVLVHSRLNE
jgi:hypothetical protein